MITLWNRFFHYFLDYWELMIEVFLSSRYKMAPNTNQISTVCIMHSKHTQVVYNTYFSQSNNVYRFNSCLRYQWFAIHKESQCSWLYRNNKCGIIANETTIIYQNPNIMDVRNCMSLYGLQQRTKMKLYNQVTIKGFMGFDWLILLTVFVSG